jgi:hypothetical protein
MRTKKKALPARIRFAPALRLLAVVTLLTGCGTTPLVLTTSDPGMDFTRYKSIAVETTAQGTSATNPAHGRITQLVKAEILSCCEKRFENVGAGTTLPHDLLVRVKLTVYEEGNRFARFMLAGLGAMQIHAQVEIADAKSGNLLSSGEAGKTFAWGGVYGASVGIEDLEKDFAKEVVKGLRQALQLNGSDVAQSVGRRDSMPE